MYGVLRRTKKSPGNDSFLSSHYGDADSGSSDRSNRESTTIGNFSPQDELLPDSGNSWRSPSLPRHLHPRYTNKDHRSFPIKQKKQSWDASTASTASSSKEFRSPTSSAADLASEQTAREGKSMKEHDLEGILVMPLKGRKSDQFHSPRVKQKKQQPESPESAASFPRVQLFNSSPESECGNKTKARVASEKRSIHRQESQGIDTEQVSVEESLIEVSSVSHEPDAPLAGFWSDSNEDEKEKRTVEVIRDIQEIERDYRRDVAQKLQAELDEARKNLALAEQEASLKRGEMQAMMDDSNASAKCWDQERSVLKNNLSQLAKQLIETQLVLKTSREQSTLLKDAVKAACEEIKKLQSEISSRLKTEQELRKEVVSAKDQLVLLETQLTSASKESASYREEQANHMKEMNRLKEELNQAKGALLVAENALHCAQNENKKLSDDLDAAIVRTDKYVQEILRLEGVWVTPDATTISDNNNPRGEPDPVSGTHLQSQLTGHMKAFLELREENLELKEHKRVSDLRIKKLERDVLVLEKKALILSGGKKAEMPPSHQVSTAVASMEESLQQHNARLKLKIANFSKTREQTNCGSDTLEVLRRSNADMAARWQKEKAFQQSTSKELDRVRVEVRAMEQRLAESKRTSEMSVTSELSATSGLSADERREMVRLRIKEKTQRIREKMGKQSREASNKGSFYA